MGSFSWIHWLLVILAVLLLFGGRGKISELMGDFAKGIKAFRAGLREDEPKPGDPPSLPQDRTPQAPGTTVGSDRRVS